ncbi:MAG: hypothetical protein BV456_06515 [Thermoplasmata archaeon M8B2D]|nr:MAG: hypothetical protein BV456_06515 [Thermoplasmata archaeon M8B2D]
MSEKIDQPNIDPKLRKTARDIKKILRRNDYAGSFVIVSKTHAEFRIHFPSWTSIQLDGNQIRVKARQVDFKSKTEQIKMFDDMVHVLENMRMVGGMIFENMNNIIKMIEKTIEITYSDDLGFVSDEED